MGVGVKGKERKGKERRGKERLQAVRVTGHGGWG